MSILCQYFVFLKIVFTIIKKKSDHIWDTDKLQITNNKLFQFYLEFIQIKKINIHK